MGTHAAYQCVGGDTRRGIKVKQQEKEMCRRKVDLREREASEMHFHQVERIKRSFTSSACSLPKVNRLIESICIQFDAAADFPVFHFTLVRLTGCE